MMVEYLTLAQLGQELSNEEREYHTQTDGTTKYGEHYIAYDVNIVSGSYMLSLHHVCLT